MAAHNIRGELVDFDIQPKSFDAYSYVDFLRSLRSNVPRRETIWLFLDNASIHRANVVKDFCCKNRIKLLFNSPYSSEFQPCEYLWNLSKRIVRHEMAKLEMTKLTAN